jgi:hypothetical protein
MEDTRCFLINATFMRMLFCDLMGQIETLLLKNLDSLQNASGQGFLSASVHAIYIPSISLSLIRLDRV